MLRPFFYPLLALSTGIVIGDSIAAPVFCLPAGMLLILTALWICVRCQWHRSALGFVLLFFLIVGMFAIQIPQYSTEHPQHLVHQANREKLTLEGIVIATDILIPNRRSLTVDCSRLLKNGVYVPVTGKIRLSVPAEFSFSYGDFVRFHSKIKTIQTFHNPGGFQYQRYLNRKGIYASGFVADRSGIVLLRSHSANPAWQKLESMRSYFKEIIRINAPTPQREILEAMTLGSQKGIPQPVLDDFAKTGVSHILSISGLHIGMVAAGGFFLILWILKRSEYFLLRFSIVKIATAAAFFPVVLYAMVAGMGTTVLRATLMTLAVLTALLIDRKKEPFNILFAAALFILIAAPESLFEISFQLSFSAVFAILYIVPKYRDLPFTSLSFAPGLVRSSFRSVYLFLLVSAAATLGTLPIVAYHFNRISAVFLPANLIAVPLLGMLTLFLMIVFLPVSICSPWLGSLFVQAASFCTDLSLKAISGLASFSWSSFPVVKPTLPEIALFYGLAFALLSLTDYPGKKDTDFSSRHPVLFKTFLVAAALLLLADAVHLAFKDWYSSDLKITAIDVGQGASTLVQMPRGVNMLIDGGGFQNSAFDMGRYVVAPFLYARRIRKIDIVVLTHPHPDHLQGLIYIVNHFNVREIWQTSWKADDDLYRLWEKTVRERKISVRHLSATSTDRQIAGVQFRFFWPLPVLEQDFREDASDASNDASLVMKISYGNNRFLVTGDISASIETRLAALYGQNLQSDVLFAPHHGSGYSSSTDFIRLVSCRFVLVSAGRNNVFGHPHPEALHRYRSENAGIYRTDIHGAISVSSNGKTISISPYVPVLPSDSEP